MLRLAYPISKRNRLAFQIEPCFSEPEELEAVAGPLMPADLPAIMPITASDFPED